MALFNPNECMAHPLYHKLMTSAFVNRVADKIASLDLA